MCDPAAAEVLFDVPSEVVPDDSAEVVEGLKAALRLGAARANRGLTASSSELLRLAEIAEQLEGTNQELEPTASPLLFGDWQLDFTDAGDVLSLGVLPVEIGAIYQNIAAGPTSQELRAQNIVEFLPRGSALLTSLGLRTLSRYAVSAECRVLGPTRVSLLFTGVGIEPFVSVLGQSWASPKLAAGLPAPTVTALEGLLNERVYLETTFLDADLRIARGPGRELYVLSRPSGTG